MENLTEIIFKTTSGHFGPIEIFDVHGIWRIVWILVLGGSSVVAFIVNILPIQFISKQSSPRRPIDILLLYDQVNISQPSDWLCQ